MDNMEHEWISDHRGEPICQRCGIDGSKPMSRECVMGYKELSRRLIRIEEKLDRVLLEMELLRNPEAPPRRG